MKLVCRFAVSLLVLAGSVATSNAWQTSGHVFCDANQNGQIDSGDVPVPGVLVIVTNTSGTFSNGDFTTTDGGFVLALPAVPDSYVEYLHPLTLPSDATVVIPAGGVYAFTLNGDPNTNFVGDFLISSSNCASVTPPPPPTTNGCCLTGGGSICAGQGQPQITFSGKAIPACGCASGDSGSWDVVSCGLRLHFQGEVLEIVNCGVTESGCKFIEFQGAGTLKGTGDNKANCGLVYFFVRAEDCGGCGSPADRLYFRAYAADGTTLLLISGDTANPLNVVPITLSGGDLQIGTSCCDQDQGDKDKAAKDKCDKDKAAKDKCDKDKAAKDKAAKDKAKGHN